MSASQFGDLKKETGLTSLNSFLADKSYIEGYTPSQADVAVFSALLSAPGSAFMHCLRWYNHIKSYTPEEQKSFPAAEQKQAKAAAAADDDDDDDFDLFGDNDDEEETEEQKRIKEERVAAYNVKKSKKTAIIAKSSLLIDVKPWDDETDMAEMERCVRTIEIDGLIWGKSQLVPLAFGIKKLQIGAVIEDDKVSTDILEEEITKFDDHVQSMDIAAFNKI